MAFLNLLCQGHILIIDLGDLHSVDIIFLLRTHMFPFKITLYEKLS